MLTPLSPRSALLPRPFLVFVGVLLVPGVCYVLGLEAGRRERVQLSEPGDRAELLALQQDFGKLRGDMETWQRSQPGKRTAVTDQSVDPEPVQAASEPQAPAQLDPVLEDQRVKAKLKQSFDAEPVDSAWSSQMRGALYDRAERVLPEASSLESCACRSTLCRIETRHATQDDYAAFKRAMLGDMRDPLPENGASLWYVQSASESEIVAVAYTARGGATIPTGL